MQQHNDSNITTSLATPNFYWNVNNQSKNTTQYQGTSTGRTPRSLVPCLCVDCQLGVRHDQYQYQNATAVPAGVMNEPTTNSHYQRQQPSFLSYVNNDHNQLQQQQNSVSSSSYQQEQQWAEESVNSQLSFGSNNAAAAEAVVQPSSTSSSKREGKKKTYVHEPYGQSMRSSTPVSHHSSSATASNIGDSEDRNNMCSTPMMMTPPTEFSTTAVQSPPAFSSQGVSELLFGNPTGSKAQRGGGSSSGSSDGGLVTTPSSRNSNNKKNRIGAGASRRVSNVKIPENVSEESITAIPQQSLASALCIPAGSSFFQAALKQFPEIALAVLTEVVVANLAQFFVDKQACYVVKAVLERLPKEVYASAVVEVLRNESFVVMLFTKDLHSRRMLQFILDTCFQETSHRFLEVAISRVVTLANDGNGCISLQRMLDRYSQPEKEVFFTMAARPNFAQFMVADQAHFILNYMLQEGEIDFNSRSVQENLLLVGGGEQQQQEGGASAAAAELLRLVLNRNASSVIEKALSNIHVQVRNDIIALLFGSLSEAQLLHFLSDTNANYVVQSAIRYSSLEVLYFIQSRCNPLMPMMSPALSARLNSLLDQAIVSRQQLQQFQ